jgi:FHS family L-fucose permease-like MFS transporter
MATQSTPPAAASAPNYLVPFITVTALFGVFGFLTSLNSTLVPYLKSIFDLAYGPAMMATVAWFFAYLVFSVPSARLIEAVGYKRTMVISLFIMLVGALLFFPAARLVSFPFFLSAIFVLASGVCALQTSANPYVSILGPERSAPARLTLAQAFNSLGSLLAPMVAGAIILKHRVVLDAAALAKKTVEERMAYKVDIASTVQMPYLAIAAALLLLGIAVMFMNLPAITSTRAFRPATDGDALVGRSIWSYRHTVLGMVGIFFYVGVEIALAAITINYCQTQGISNVETAGFLLSLYFVCMMIGRFVGSFIMKWIKAEKLLVLLGFLGVALLLVSMFTHGPVAIWSLVLCGIANSVMYPNIFALGIAELGPMTSKGSGVLTIGNVGGAVIPLLFGALADKVGIQYAFFLPILGYLYVAFYGLSGYKPVHTVKA